MRGTRSACAGRWFEHPVRSERSELRLYCLPPEGVGATAYLGWAGHLPDWVEASPVQLPGRENRRGEPHVRDMAQLVEALRKAAATEPELRFALFGHGLGARIAFEWARAARRAGEASPVLLAVSEHPPPGRPAPASLPLHSSARILATLARYYPGQEAWGRAVGSGIVETYAADIALAQSRSYVWEAPLSVPLVSFGRGPAPSPALAPIEGWGEETSAGYEDVRLPGDPFFERAAREALLRRLSSALERVRYTQPRPEALPDRDVPCSSLAVPAWRYLSVGSR